MKNDTARQLAQHAQAGDTEALSLLIDTLRVSLFAVVYGELRDYDDAQDAVVSALLRVVKHLPSLRDPEQVRAWAARIARNEARRLIRSPEATLPDDDNIPADHSGVSLLRLDVERELRCLPRAQARACALFYFDGYDIAQVARKLGRPEGTIKYWLHRVRGHLREQLKDEYLMETDIYTKDRERDWTAIIAGSDFAPAMVPEVMQALRRAGWKHIAHIEDVMAVAQIGSGDKAAPFADCRLVVLGEQSGGHSAFEWSALWRASDEGQDLSLLLIADGNRPEPERMLTARAAYSAGFSLLLNRPFKTEELETFAYHIFKSIETTTR